jgi:asparagine synthase (glutamine-hydrolysing)
MCGIVAIFNKKTFDVWEDELSWQALFNMHDKIKHRGIDEIQTMQHEKLKLIYNRLSITDRNIKSKNQLTSSNWNVFLNGEIYNYKELNYSGTEKQVIEQGLDNEGFDFIKKLNGMFFIIAFHGNNVYLIRDRYGIKPCYIYETKKEILIASEIKAITSHPDFEFNIDEDSKHDWLTYNNIFFSNNTLFNGVRQLHKGSIFHLNNGVSTLYWSWKFEPQEMDYEFAKNKICELIIQAVKRQIPQEVNYGTCLSAGIDSNIINKLLPNDIYTFTAGFKNTNDETELAKLSGKKHYEIIFDKVRDFEKTIYHLEDLRVGASWSNYGLYELASKYVKVLFDGAGSDELFGGYKWRYDMNKPYEHVLNRTGNFGGLTKILLNKFNDTIENRFGFDADYFLPGVLSVVDKLSMAHTIEVRLPFLDNDLVDFCLTLPNEFKENKKILKDAFADILPQEILDQPKRGFSSPDWIPGEGNQANKWAVAAFKEWEKQFKK